MYVFAFVVLILGCFLGAGFVSGKEVARYFSIFGKYSLLGILVLSILMFFLLMFFLFISNKVDNFKEFINKYFFKESGVLRFLFVFTMTIFIGSMFAGNLVLAEYFNVNKIVMILITSILTFLLVVGKVKFLSAINMILMPMIICFLVYLTFSFKIGNYVEGSAPLSILSSLNYCMINIVPLGVFIIDIKNRRKLTKKEIVLISAIVSMVIMILLIIYNNSILLNNLEGVSMPIIVLGCSGGIILKIVTFISLYFGMITTLISCVFVVSNYINEYISDYRHSTMLTINLGLIVSFFGFNVIVDYVYILIAIIGFYFVVSSVIKEKRNLKNQVS